MFALWSAVKSPLMLGSDLSEVESTSDTFKVNKYIELSKMRCEFSEQIYGFGITSMPISATSVKRKR